jgi:membrane protein implicated in regulation of membrane protease activity
MEITTIWWLLAGAAVGLELLTGTFYLLMFALGLAAGAIAAHLGLSQPLQIVIAAAVGGGAVLYWHSRQSKLKALEGASTASNHNVHLDIGSSVEVVAWSPSGTARVVHRGTEWAARHAGKHLHSGGHFESGLHRITAVEGNTLVLAKI